MRSTILFYCLFLLLFKNTPAQSQKNMQISSVSLIQTELPAGIGDTSQRIIAVKVAAVEQLDTLRVNSLTFSMTGTTTIKDVKNIKIYYSGNNRIFLQHTAKLFAAVKPAAGNISAKGSQILPDGTIGMYYENGENSIYQMYFVRFSLKWLTGGADIFKPSKNQNSKKLAKT